MIRAYGIYRATVVNDVDPELRGRLQIEARSVLGNAASNWALPCSPVGLDVITPSPGEPVWVMFEDGDVTRPVWAGVGFAQHLAQEHIRTVTMTNVVGLVAALDGKYSPTNPPPATDLSAYVTNTSLATTLSSYVTSTSLTTTLGSYVTSTALDTALTPYARKDTAQTFTLAQTFSVAPVVPDDSWSIAKTTGLQTALDGKYSAANPPPYPADAVSSVNTRTGAVTGLAEANAVVDLTTAQTIGGGKTFSASIVYAPPTSTGYVSVSSEAGRGTLTLRNETNPGVVNQINGRIFGQGSDSLGTNTTFSEVRFGITSPTDAAEFGAVRLLAVNSGTLTEQLTVDPGNGYSTLIRSGTAGVRGLVVRGAASQAENLQEWQDSAGTMLSRVDPTGVMYEGSAPVLLKGHANAANQGRNTLRVTNLNQAFASGWYEISGGAAGAVGAPTADWYLVNVIAYTGGTTTTGFVRQVAHAMTHGGGSPIVYQRRCNGGDPAVAASWTAWVATSGGDVVWRVVGGSLQPGYENGWTAYPTTYGPLRFRKDGNVVYIQGLATPGTTNTAIFTLPTGYRPVGNELIFPSVSGGAFAEIRIFQGGAVQHNAGGLTGWLTLTCSFYASA